MKYFLKEMLKGLDKLKNKIDIFEGQNGTETQSAECGSEVTGL